MRTVTRRAIRLVVIAALIAASSGDQSIRACGPFFPRSVFRYAAHPEYPLEAYAAGRLGVVAPTWARSQLVVAYRYLSGAPLDAGEQAGAVDLWARRYGGDWGGRAGDAADEWLKTRQRFPDLPKISWVLAFRYEPKWLASWLNCGDDAFRTATATLTDRASSHGDQPEMVRDWILGQDAVFSNCSGEAPSGAAKPADPSVAPPGLLMPAPVPPGAPEWLKADREYQAAAARFYGTDYSGAAAAFRSIAASRTSPWRTLAPYLVARAWIRSATVAGSSDGLDRADTELKRILADASQSSMHGLAQGLLGYVRGWRDPAGQAAELAAKLRGRLSQAEFATALTDYTVLLDRAGGKPGPSDRSGAGTAAGRDDMTDWIQKFQDADPAAGRDAIKHWQDGHALPWLVVALSKAKPSDADVPALIDAASKLRPTSPGLESTAYHVLRLRLGRGETDRVRADIDLLLPDARKSWTRSGLNGLLEMRLSLARSLQEALTYGVRQPAGRSTTDDDRELPAGFESPSDAPSSSTGDAELEFDEDFGRIVNGLLPARLAAEVARSRALPAKLRRDLAVAVWFRAAMLGESAIASGLAPELAAAYPAMKPLVDAYSAAGDEEGRKFAAAFAALRFPGIRPEVSINLGRQTPIDRIDDFKDNWWCAGDDTAQTLPYPPPSILSEADRRQAQTEWDQIRHLPTGPNYLSRIAIEWARRHPADPRVPEALHLAVRSTRFGCTDDATTSFSRQAFTLLHKNYPASEWTKKTPYYY